VFMDRKTLLDLYLASVCRNFRHCGFIFYYRIQSL
jgi:hypothetical protein